jgi:hypothetical protein
VRTEANRARVLLLKLTLKLRQDKIRRGLQLFTATLLTPRYLILSHMLHFRCAASWRLVSARLVSARLVSAVTWVSSGVVAVVAGSVCVRAAFALASLAFSFRPAHADTQMRRFQEAQACTFLSVSLSLSHCLSLARSLTRCLAVSLSLLLLLSLSLARARVLSQSRDDADK